MSFFFNGAQANVTISNTGGVVASVPQVAATQTFVRASATNNTTIYTPTAGKTFYLYGISTSNTIAILQLLARDGATPIGLFGGGATAAACKDLVGGSCPLETYVNANPVKINVATAGVNVSCWGVEA
jgi:hypothetical protein